MTNPASAYEAWVLGLQAWSKDPNYDLGRLPRLGPESLPPSAYDRLLAHIMAAQQELMKTWQQRLERNIAQARTEHDYARTFVELRALLARRLQLASHPALPPQIQQPLIDGVKRDVLRIQQDLESAVTQSSSGTGVQLAVRERMLRLVRANSFTVILQPDFPLESLFVSSPSIPRAQPSPAPVRVTRRRVVVNDG